MNDHIDYIENAHDFDSQQFTSEEIEQLGEQLLSEATSIEDKKKALGILAHRGDLQAYNFLKRYAEKPDTGMEEWSKLALGECHLFLHADLDGDDESFNIFTGVGKNNNMLRIYYLILPHEDRTFDSWQQDIIRKEMTWVAADLKCEAVEWFDCKSHYVALSVLLPVTLSVGGYIDKAITACNVFGDFVMPEYYAGSGIPDAKEIEEIINIVRYGQDYDRENKEDKQPF